VEFKIWTLQKKKTQHQKKRVTWEARQSRDTEPRSPRLWETTLGKGEVFGKGRQAYSSERKGKLNSNVKGMGGLRGEDYFIRKTGVPKGLRCFVQEDEKPWKI